MINKKELTVKDITLISIFVIILFLQEQILSFIPNVSLTFFLLILFSKKLGLYKTFLIILCHTLLDVFLFNNGLYVYMLFMFVGLMFIPLLLNTLFEKINSPIGLALLSIVFSLLYSWINIIPSVVIYNMNLFDYLLFDIVWELILVTSNFVIVLLLYKPISKVFDKILYIKMSK